MSKRKQVVQIIHALRKATRDMPEPMSTIIAKEYHKDPYIILISCLLSLRARDVVTLPISRKLFSTVKTPQQMVKMSQSELEKIIHPLGFFRRKATVLKQVSKELIDRFHGKVPHTQEELMSLPGVGIKTANLVLGVAFDIPALCVDTHVHRLSNQLGLVHTKTPEQTEKALQKVIPRNNWIEWNHLLVKWGQSRKPITELSIKKERKS